MCYNMKALAAENIVVVRFVTCLMMILLPSDTKITISKYLSNLKNYLLK